MPRVPWLAIPEVQRGKAQQVNEECLNFALTLMHRLKICMHINYRIPMRHNKVNLAWPERYTTNLAH